MLYAVDQAATETTPSEIFDGVADHFDLPAGARDFAWKLVEGVVAERSNLDACLEATSSNWRVDRMAIVDRNVLRLAAFELLHSDTPLEVVLDEAVELARRFGAERSPAFVNGVLDALAARGGAPAPSPDADEEPAETGEPGA